MREQRTENRLQERGGRTRRGALRALPATGYRLPARRRGFTILLATLTASLMLLLGASIYSIISKQISLSSIGRDSQFAFYAADTGAECALFWDTRFDAFASTTGYTGADCDGQDLGTITYQGLNTPMEFQFEPNGLCVIVEVTKADTFPNTTIQARGYSTDCESITTSPRALERAVEITY